MSLKEIQVVIQTHQEWLNSKGVSGLQANFKGMDLSGYDLRQQDLSGADFTEVNLQQANLEKQISKVLTFKMPTWTFQTCTEPTSGGLILLVRLSDTPV